MRYLLFSGLISLFMISPVLATHELDHRVTFVGVLYSEQGVPLPETRVELRDPAMTDPLATTTTTAIGAFQLVGHLHDADHGRRLELVAGPQRQIFLVAFDPTDRTRERVQRIDIGQPARGELIRPALGFLGLVALATIFTIRHRRANQAQSQSRH